MGRPPVDYTLYASVVVSTLVVGFLLACVAGGVARWYRDGKGKKYSAVVAPAVGPGPAPSPLPQLDSVCPSHDGRQWKNPAAVEFEAFEDVASENSINLEDETGMVYMARRAAAVMPARVDPARV